ncbi:hypothetical protein CACET_c02720 [Clostridium aceticum]|uniref:Uncharacterized protein n=1 Tax=Clostridium aceticum TaxID=84022 RepID=A0A0D8I700_9CLOT|nr:hypothetical protein [Clostridium aceticum]AKL93788.1 hypothetical protein CACET_c02720 [Clostridium aceticum]KJF25822.1 hypothetical protein TZ02_16630 [Clostridium aceticum]
MANEDLTKNKIEKSKKILITVLIIFFSISLWGFVVYYGYTYAKDYIDTTIRNVQQENAMNIQQLSEEVHTLKQEIVNLIQSLESTDSTLSDSASLQIRIDRRLEILDQNLKELEKSLKILKEAPSVQN